MSAMWGFTFDTYSGDVVVIVMMIIITIVCIHTIDRWMYGYVSYHMIYLVKSALVQWHLNNDIGITML